MSNHGYAIIDEDDYERLSLHTWYHYKNEKYAYTRIDGKKIYMHRFVMNAQSGQIIDHINGDTLDNRKQNLRFCTRAENSYNSKSRSRASSKYKGVTFDGSRKKWLVYITVDKKRFYIGAFTCEGAAANAYNYYAEKYHVDFAYLNDVPFMTKDEWRKYCTRNTSSKYNGVSWDKNCGKWEAYVHIKRKKKNVGYFDDELEAAKAYNEYVKSNNITSAKLNKLKEDNIEYKLKSIDH